MIVDHDPGDEHRADETPFADLINLTTRVVDRFLNQAESLLLEEARRRQFRYVLGVSNEAE